MDAVRFLKEKSRMCDKYRCKNCPLSIANNGTGEGCDYLVRNNPEKAVEIVEKWSAEHPVKTRQSEFLKIVPDATIRNGILKLKPCEVNEEIKARCKEYDYCRDCRKEYWLAEVE